MQNVIDNQNFEILCQNILEEQTGTESKMTIRYLKDVSSLLALVFAVCKKNLERHLQAEREMLKYIFAFDLRNYARYLSYQWVYLRSLEANNGPAVSHLKKRGFVGSVSGQPFSAIQGDLVFKIFNGQTKRKAGLHASGFSTNIDTGNDRVNTAHILVQIRAVLFRKTTINNKFSA